LDASGLAIWQLSAHYRTCTNDSLLRSQPLRSANQASASPAQFAAGREMHFARDMPDKMKGPWLRSPKPARKNQHEQNRQQIGLLTIWTHTKKLQFAVHSSANTLNPKYGCPMIPSTIDAMLAACCSMCLQCNHLDETAFPPCDLKRDDSP